MGKTGTGRVWIGAALAGVALGMLGLAFAAVPLYDAFCRITGYGGTTQVADGEMPIPVDVAVTVRFDANMDSTLPWRFRPLDRAVSVKLGEPGLARYEVTNLSDKPLVGIAAYNVSPPKVGVYFTKLDCFCFKNQRLAPGETQIMPVLFYVDPSMLDDKGADEVREITLSYTFYPVTETAHAR